MDLAKPGDSPRADFINEGIRAKRMLDGLKGGHGLSVRTSPEGILLALAGGASGYVLPGIITAAPPPGVLILPSLCRYTVKSLEEQFELQNVFPDYGRQVENDEVGVYPAKVGDFCLIIRYTDLAGDVVAKLMVLRENPGRGACGSPGS